MSKTIRKRTARVARVPVSLKAKGQVEADKPAMTKLRRVTDKDGNTVIIATR